MRTTPSTQPGSNGSRLRGARALLGALAVLSLACSATAEAQRKPRGNGARKPPADSAPASESTPAPEVPPAPDASSAPGTPGAVPASEPWVPPSSATPPASAGGAGATPQPESSAPEPAEPPPQAEAQSALAKDVASVMDDLVQLRTRTRVLGKALFKTKVRIRVENEAAPDQVAVKLQLWLDGAPVWTGDGAALRDPERVLFEGLAAPGPHVLTYEVEQRARDDEAYRYTQRASLRFVALRERRMDLTLVLEDDSDMAEDFDEDEEGEYDVRVLLQVSAHRLGD